MSSYLNAKRHWFVTRNSLNFIKKQKELRNKIKDKNWGWKSTYVKAGAETQDFASNSERFTKELCHLRRIWLLKYQRIRRR